MRVLKIMKTGPRTNHTQFVDKPQGAYAYVTVGGLNETLVFRRNGGHPHLVKKIQNHGFGPHGIWPSPDGSRIYVALQNSDAVDVIDTATNTITATIRVGQDPMALVYVANAVPHGRGRGGLTRQGLDKPIETVPVGLHGVPGKASLTVRTVSGIDQLVFNARGLPANKTFTVSRSPAGRKLRDTFSITANASGNVDQALAYTDFFGVYRSAFLTTAPPGRQTASFARHHLLCEL